VEGCGEQASTNGRLSEKFRVEETEFTIANIISSIKNKCTLYNGLDLPMRLLQFPIVHS
jgi:hypothetical protein